MRLSLLGALFLCALGAPPSLQAQHHHQHSGHHGVPGAAQAQRHNPFSPRYTPVGFSGGSSWASTVVVGSGLTAGFGSFGPYAPGYFGPGYYGPGFCGTGYGGYGGWYQSSAPLYPYGFNGVWGPYSSYGPLVLPGNQLFGPAALPQGAFLPQQQPVAAPLPNLPAQNPAQNPAAQIPQQQPVRPAVARKAPANAEALERSLRFIDFGDRLFGEQKYLEAYTRYQSACHAAPDLADAHFRRGFALAVLGRYERATEAFQQGLQLNPRWSESKFRLDDLYGQNQAAKKALFDVLATRLEQNPDQFDAMFLLGVLLYFDGQDERSRPFMQKASALWRERQAAPAADRPAAARPLANPPGEKPGEI